MNPALSVCIPSYNNAKYLPEAIESALGQTYRDFEVVIIDDCSSDNSAEIIRSHASRDSRIVYSINDRNLGMVNNWNRCLRQARGAYVKFLFGDDLLSSPDALRKMVSVMESDQSLALVASARNIIDGNSRVIKTASKYRSETGRPGTEVIRECLIDQKNRIGEPSVVLFRKQAAVRGFSEEYRQFVDLEMWFHILEQGNFAYIDEPLCSFRVHPEQQTWHNLDTEVHLFEPFLLLRDYLMKPALDLSPFERAYARYHAVYVIRKHYRRHHKSWALARKKMGPYYRYRWYAYYPLYPSYALAKSCLTLRRHLRNALTKRGCGIERSSHTMKP